MKRRKSFRTVQDIALSTHFHETTKRDRTGEVDPSENNKASVRITEAANALVQDVFGLLLERYGNVLYHFVFLFHMKKKKSWLKEVVGTQVEGTIWPTMYDFTKKRQGVEGFSM